MIRNTLFVSSCLHFFINATLLKHMQREETLNLQIRAKQYHTIYLVHTLNNILSLSYVPMLDSILLRNSQNFDSGNAFVNKSPSWFLVSIH